MEIVESGKYTFEEKYGFGPTIHIISEATGIKTEYDVENTEYVENERAAWRITAGNLTMIGQSILKSTNKGTRLTFEIDYQVPYSILEKIIEQKNQR